MINFSKMMTHFSESHSFNKAMIGWKCFIVKG